MNGRAVLAVLVTALISACGPLIPPPRYPVEPPPVSPSPTPTPTPTPVPPTVRAGPSVSALGIAEADAAGALRSFIESCPQLLSRTDASRLTAAGDWQPACAAARSWPAGQAASFFATWFETAQVADGAAFATGYFEPEIAGARQRLPGYDVPVYRVPPDLVRGWPAETPPEQRTGRPPLGRYDAAGRFVQYYERAEIEDGALAGKGLEIAWALDPIEMFFLQIQGSGRLRTPDGTVMRIGYAGQNGREYVGVGSVMRERGLLGDAPGQYPGSMQGIVQYLRDHPEEGRALMRQNKSWVFFRELVGDGPLGALGVPVRADSSVAADPAYTPLGAPVWLSVDRPEANGLWIAQDTGGAIKGANRFDTFWGAGARAQTIAGGMSARGRAYILVPKGTLARRATP
ncbi:MAG: murein transglycosylase A [Novosphingobium sp.]|nr:murein transglycosylase A [Novosphingobium sp.]